MGPKKSTISRFFTLLFTDKDTKQEDEIFEVKEPEKNIDFIDPMSDDIIPPWEDRLSEDIISSLTEIIAPEETKEEPKKEEKKSISITPDFIGPGTEDIDTHHLKGMNGNGKNSAQPKSDPIRDILFGTKPLIVDTAPEETQEEISAFEEAIPEVSEVQNKEHLVQKKTKDQPITQPGTITLGLTKDGKDVVSVTTEALKRHMLVVGMTGSGKTTMIERMILQDIEAGRGVGLIDPHGDLYERILAQIPKSRSNDVVLFDLTDTEYPIGFNILENTHEQFPSLIASSIVGVFKKIFGYSWGPRLEYILRNATLTLLEKQGSTLLDLTLLLTDEDYRRSYVQKISNPFLKKFWSDEFENMSLSKQNEVVSPILNKVGQFLSVPLIRNIISQPQSGFSPRWVMDNKKIFLANLSKGKIGEDVSEMLGSLLVSKFQLDVMSRADTSPEKREQFTLFVDEFQNFATESFGDILSEARKYGLGLVIAHQYLGQANSQLLDAIMGNVGNIGVFHVGASDAKTLAPNLGQGIDPHSLSEQQLYNFTLKTTSEEGKKILQGELLHPDMIGIPTGLQSPAKLQSLVREKYAKERSFVEGKLNTKMS